jgi:hypothetical protein
MISCGLADELVRRRVAVIIASTNAGALAAKQATTTIPIVFNIGEDPVKIGLIKSFNRPGGNMTGVTQFGVGLTGKRLGLLREMVPAATTMAVLVNPKSVNAQPQLDDAQEAVARLGVRLTRTHEDCPGHNSIRRNFHSKGNMLQGLAEWAGANSDYSDIAVMLADAAPAQPAEPRSALDGFVYLIGSSVHYKVGRSDELERRVKEIRIALPEAATLEHSMRTAAASSKR